MTTPISHTPRPHCPSLPKFTTSPLTCKGVVFTVALLTLAQSHSAEAFVPVAAVAPLATLLTGPLGITVALSATVAWGIWMLGPKEDVTDASVPSDSNECDIGGALEGLGALSGM